MSKSETIVWKARSLKCRLRPYYQRRIKFAYSIVDYDSDKLCWSNFTRKQALYHRAIDEQCYLRDTNRLPSASKEQIQKKIVSTKTL